MWSGHRNHDTLGFLAKTGSWLLFISKVFEISQPSMEGYKFYCSATLSYVRRDIMIIFIFKSHMFLKWRIKFLNKNIMLYFTQIKV